MEVVLSLIAQREVEVVLAGAGVVTRFVVVARVKREGGGDTRMRLHFKVESE